MKLNNVKMQNKAIDKKSMADIGLIIPVVYATDDNYVRYTATSIESALRSRRSDCLYDFYILIPDELSEQGKNTLQTIVNRFSLSHITFVEMHGSFSDANIAIDHITVPTYYRLLIPQILANIEKCIYLDGDTIVCGDLADLYCHDLNNNYLSGVPAFGYCRDMQQECLRLGISDFDVYINAGVLLMNLQLMRKDRLVDTFISLLDRDYSSQDQDILNVACHGKISILPYKYNVMVDHINLDRNYLAQFIDLNFFDDAIRTPTVIHYASKRKPWNDLFVYKADEWWRIVLDGETWVLYAKDKTEFIISSLFSKKREENNSGLLDEKYYYQELLNVRASYSYRIGRALTWLPRKVRELLHSCRRPE